MAWSATSAPPQKAGMTVLLIERRLIVLPCTTAAAKLTWKEKLQTYQSPSTAKVVSRLQYAARKPARLLFKIPQRTSTSVSSTAAKVTYAMEPKYRWSAPLCC